MNSELYPHKSFDTAMEDAIVETAQVHQPFAPTIAYQGKELVICVQLWDWDAEREISYYVRYHNAYDISNGEVQNSIEHKWVSKDQVVKILMSLHLPLAYGWLSSKQSDDARISRLKTWGLYNNAYYTPSADSKNRNDPLKYE